jgi:hypothetical protein
MGTAGETKQWVQQNLGAAPGREWEEAGPNCEFATPTGSGS